MASQTIFASGLLTVTDVSCRMHRSGPDPAERVEAPRLIVVRRGVFTCGFPREDVLADANTVLCLNAGDSMQVSHPCDEGDDCSVLIFPPEVFHEARAGGFSEMRPFARRHLALDGPAQYAQRLFHHQLRNPDALPIEENALGLLAGLAWRLNGNGAPSAARPNASERRAVEQVRGLIASQPEARASLAEIAAQAHYSPFHLARLFHAITGQSLHRYRLQLRLSLALERLEQGENNLTRLALDLGFESHSHFSATFKRFFDCTPLQARRALSRGDLQSSARI